MARSLGRTRTRYPIHAALGVAAAGFWLAFNMIVGFLFMALVPPLIPVYVCILFAGMSLVESALRYAQRVSIRQPAVMLQTGQHEQRFREPAQASRK